MIGCRVRSAIAIVFISFYFYGSQTIIELSSDGCTASENSGADEIPYLMFNSETDHAAPKSAHVYGNPSAMCHREGGKNR